MCVNNKKHKQSEDITGSSGAKFRNHSKLKSQQTYCMKTYVARPGTKWQMTRVNNKLDENAPKPPNQLTDEAHENQFG